ncbi:uncharacterized protein N7498_008263 [Penicillium cinerascens]|uniref:Uncharacterized protein n=1 Tax=Penicillium cinerascens TaxID=70096 RepID=A0A9W9JDC7_9EURO|nr:uncharacterized protein N7498_008263 [Penicillium cinerascens]KAJ5194825.1 hypothetical protein N7498_008263 [Penicillium cinerascens]
MSPQDTTGHPAEDKLEGLSKYLKRMKTVLRPRSGSKRQSMTIAPEVTGQSSTTATSAIATAPKPVVEQPAMLANYSVIQQQKARTLFAKYGLTLEPEEWKLPTDLQLARVTKPIRMRVRRTCHRCDTTFGPDKVCVNCQHPRCKKCPRFPPHEHKDAEQPRIPKPKILEIRARQYGAPSLNQHFMLTGDPNAPLKMQSRSSGQDLICKPVRQRVRRSCHSCGKVFAGGSKECECCKHIRCKKCPREPPKPDKYPDGYPGDVDPPDLLKLKPDRTFRKSRRRVHYICHVCDTGYNEGANTCGKCGQAKCAETIRIPPKKVKRDPDPEVVRRVEERIAALNIQE